MSNNENLLKDKLNKYPEMMTVNHLQELFNMGRNQAYNLCHDHTFPAIRIGKKSIRIPKSLLIKWLQNKIDKKLSKECKK